MKSPKSEEIVRDFFARKGFHARRTQTRDPAPTRFGTLIAQTMQCDAHTFRIVHGRFTENAPSSVIIVAGFSEHRAATEREGVTDRKRETRVSPPAGLLSLVGGPCTPWARTLYAKATGCTTGVCGCPA